MNNCKNCRYDYKSYHCLDCKNYHGSDTDLQAFCKYCNQHSCNNCVWNDQPK